VLPVIGDKGYMGWWPHVVRENPMNRATIFATIGIALALYATSATAAFKTGNDLLEWCTTPANLLLCYGYIEGVADAIGGGDVVRGSRTCIPNGVTVEQTKDATIWYLQNHIATRHEPGAALVAAALADIFPCR
jgi:hypothetical protein